jgi:hypothetical protein
MPHMGSEIWWMTSLQAGHQTCLALLAFSRFLFGLGTIVLKGGQHSIRYRPRAKIIPLQQTLLPRHASLLHHLRHHPRRRPRNHHPLDRLRPVLRTAMPLL